jgi:hypothetical protein
MTEIQNWKFYYKFIHQEVPTYFLNWNVPDHSDIHFYETRGRHKYIPPRLKYNISACMAKHRIPTMVNEATSQLREKIYSHSLKGFVYYLKQAFVSSYTIIVQLKIAMFANLILSVVSLDA